MPAEYNYGVYYREVNEETAEYAAHMTEVISRTFNKWLPADANMDVLDIGCGMGFAMSTLKLKGYRTVVGVDTDRSQVEACKKRNLDAELIDDLSNYLDENTNRFGLVMMIDVLEHIPTSQQIAILKKVRASLLPGGRLIIRVPNASSIISPRWQYQDFTHHCSFTELSIKFVLVNSGFLTVEVPVDDNLEPRPSFRPSVIFTKVNRIQFKRWIIRRLWRQVLIVEVGERRADSIPLGLNLIAIADKPSS